MTLSATTTTREAFASLDVFHRTLAEMMLEKGLLVLVDGDPDQSDRSGGKDSRNNQRGGEP